MKTAPATSFIVSQPKLLFEILVVALDAPAHVGRRHQIVQRHGFGQARQIVLERFGIAGRPLDQQPLLGLQAGAADVAARVAYPKRGKTPLECLVATLAPTDGLERIGRQRLRQFLDRHRLTCRSAPRHHRRAPLAAVALGRQGLEAGRPDGDGRGDPHHVRQAHLGESAAKPLIDAVAGVGQHAVLRSTLIEQRLQLLQRDLVLGGELNLGRNASLVAPLGILGPVLGQVQPPGYRQTRLIVGHRDADRHLAVVLLAQHPAILARHTDRVPALLREARVVDDPVAAAGPVHLRHHPLCNPAQQLLVGPFGLGHKVVQRLMPGAGVQRIHPCGHRFHALARQRQHQPGAVPLQPRMTVPMPKPRRQVCHVALKPPVRTHRSSQTGRRSAYNTLDLLTQ